MKPLRKQKGDVAALRNTMSVLQEESDFELGEDLRLRSDNDPRWRSAQTGGNPIYAWLAFRAAREDGAKLPAWVVQYLDAVATQLCALVQRERPVDAVDVAECLGLWQRGRKKNAFRAFSEAAPELIVRDIVWHRKNGCNYSQAMATVAEEWGSDDRTIEKTWAKHRSMIGGLEGVGLCPFNTTTTGGISLAQVLGLPRRP